MENIKEGYIFMGFGKKYVDECQLCAEMIDAYDKDRPKAILTNKADYEYAKTKEVFDDIIVLDYETEKYLKDEKNSHNLYCVIPRILMSDIIPYEKTLAIDSDIACIANPNRMWDYINEKNEPFVCCGYDYLASWHWGKVAQVDKKVGKKIPAIHGGLLCFNKGHENYKKFRDDCFDALDNYADYGCLTQFRGGMTDEVIFAIAMAKNNITPMDYVEYPVVSFNLPFEVGLPCHFHTINGLKRNTWVKCNKPIMFNHLFFHERNNQRLYNDFLNFHKKITNGI